MEFNDFDWDQKIISDIFFDINYELGKKNVFNSTSFSNKPNPETKDTKKDILYNNTDNINNTSSLKYIDNYNLYDNHMYGNHIYDNHINDYSDDVFGIKFPYTKKFYIILCFILFIICIYLYNMISRYDSLLLMVLSKKT